MAAPAPQAPMRVPQYSGPTLLEPIDAALGSSIALHVHQFWRSRGLPTEGLRVEVVQHSAPHPRFVATIQMLGDVEPGPPLRHTRHSPR